MAISQSLLAFFEETETHMEEVEAALLDLEKDNTKVDLVNELFRLIHSIKGNAGLVGFKEIHTMSTVIETMLDKLRKEKQSVTQKDLDRLFEFLDNMNTLLEKAGKEHGFHGKMEIRPDSAVKTTTGSDAKVSGAKKGVGGGSDNKQVGKTEEKEDAATPDSSGSRNGEKKLEAYLTFKLGKESYGVDINKVMEIILNRNITRVPRSKNYVTGIMNLRGMVIPVINARKKLKFGSDKTNGKTEADAAMAGNSASGWENIIIIENDGLRTGILVDVVDDIVRFKDDMIVSAAQALGGINTEFIHGVGKMDAKTVILLDIGTFCNPKEEYF